MEVPCFFLFRLLHKNDFLRCSQGWCDENLIDVRYTNSVEDLATTIKLCGGVLDSRKTFKDCTKYKNGNIVYQKDNEREKIRDERGAFVTKKEDQVKSCYLLPWKWKPMSKYMKQ